MELSIANYSVAGIVTICSLDIALDKSTVDSNNMSNQSPVSRSWLSAWLRHLGYRPLVYLSAALVLGVVAAEQFRVAFSLILLIPLIATGAAFLISRASIYSHLWLAAAFFFAGICLHATQFIVAAHDISQFAPREYARIEGRVIDITDQHPYWRRFVVSVESVTASDRRWSATGRITLSESDWQQQLEVGRRLSVEVTDLTLPLPAMNLGQFDMRRYLARQGITAQARMKAVRLSPRPISWQSKLKNLTRLSRQRALRNLQQAMPGTNSDFYAHLMAGMVYGMHAARGIDKTTEDLFRKTGTIHLLVVSGAQITFIIFALILLVTVGRRRALHPWHLGIIVPVVIAFALLAGLAPSVARSLIMAGILIYALVTGRRYDLPNAVALAVFVLVIGDTNIVFDIGAQLTFAAAIGVALYAPRSYRDVLGIVHRPHLTVTILLATLGAWIMVTPILGHHFYSFAALGNLANAIAVPISILVMPLGMIALVTGSVLMPVTVALCGLARVLMQVMLLSNELFAQLPGAYCDNIYFSWPIVILWYGGLGGLALIALKPHLRSCAAELARQLDWRWLAIAAVGAAAVIVTFMATNKPQQRLRVTFLAVGEGQCAVIESPSGPVLMVDAGSRQYPGLRGEMLADRVILPFLARRGIRKLDALLITHPQSDHCNAVPRLLQRMPVGVILEPGFDADTQVWREVEKAIRGHRIPVKTIRAGGQINLGEPIKVLALAPSRPLIRGSRDDLNNNSVVLRLDYGQVSLLTLADQEKTGLERLITWSRQHDISLGSTIMQVPHHGRNLRYAGPIIRLSQPRLGIISNHQPLTVQRTGLLPRSLDFATTGKVGMVTIETDGEEVRVCRFLTGCRMLER